MSATFLLSFRPDEISRTAMRKSKRTNSRRLDRDAVDNGAGRGTEILGNAEEMLQMCVEHVKRGARDTTDSPPVARPDMKQWEVTPAFRSSVYSTQLRPLISTVFYTPVARKESDASLRFLTSRLADVDDGERRC